MFGVRLYGAADAAANTIGDIGTESPAGVRVVVHYGIEAHFDCPS